MMLQFIPRQLFILVASDFLFYYTCFVKGNERLGCCCKKGSNTVSVSSVWKKSPAFQMKKYTVAFQINVCLINCKEI